MITSVHTIIFSKNAEAARDFFKDVVKLDAVDAGGGWLIFALPPAELAVHPTDGPGMHELYLVCDDVKRTTAELQAKGVEIVQPITDEGWGLLTRIRIPSGDEIGLYEPRHPQPHETAAR